MSLRDLALTAGQESARAVGWREGDRGPLSSSFIALRVRPANDAQRQDDGVLPARWLLAEWPEGKDEPVTYWLSNLPADTPLVTLVQFAKLRWRVEHDYRELKQCLGLDHYEGRSYWHARRRRHSHRRRHRLDRSRRPPAARLRRIRSGVREGGPLRQSRREEIRTGLTRRLPL